MFNSNIAGDALSSQAGESLWTDLATGLVSPLDPALEHELHHLSNQQSLREAIGDHGPTTVLRTLLTVADVITALELTGRHLSMLHSDRFHDISHALRGATENREEAWVSIIFDLDVNPHSLMDARQPSVRRLGVVRDAVESWFRDDQDAGREPGYGFEDLLPFLIDHSEFASIGMPERIQASVLHAHATDRLMLSSLTDNVRPAVMRELTEHRDALAASNDVHDRLVAWQHEIATQPTPELLEAMNNIMIDLEDWTLERPPSAWLEEFQAAWGSFRTKGRVDPAFLPWSCAMPMQYWELVAEEIRWRWTNG